MREGSYAQIEPGMHVVDRDGGNLGAVDEALVDEASNIFHGVVIRPGLLQRPLFCPANRVVRVHDGVLHVDAAEGELEVYEAPGDRHRDLEERYEDARTT